MTKYLITITGPSGVGKTTLVRHITKLHKGTAEIVSDTTRKPRENEIDGIDYNFLSKNQMKKRTLVESAQYNGYEYGIAEEEIESKLKSNIVFAVVSVEGMICLKHYMHNHHPEVQCVSIFLDTPPQYLVNRLIQRGDSVENVIQRIENIKKTKEYDNREFCDCVFRPSPRESENVTDMVLSFLDFLQKLMIERS